MFENRRALVTGAKGFLGSHLAARARAEGWDVIETSRRATKAGGASLDICDSTSARAVFSSAKPSLVIHCAAYGVNYAEQDFDTAVAVNVEGTLNVLAAAAGCGAERVLLVGSCFEYGSRQGPIREDAMLAPTATYGATKAAATILASERARVLKLPLVIARPFGIWGRGEAPHRLVPQIIASCRSRSPLKLTDCEVIRDLSYVEDVAANIVALATSPGVASGAVVNIGSGVGTKLRDFVLSVARLMGGEDLMQFGALPYRATEMPCLVADVRRMHELVGPRPTTSLTEGIRRMIEGSS